MLTWPHADSDWGPSLAAVYPVFAAIGREIAAREPVLSVCLSREHAREVHQLLTAQGARADRLRFALAASNDTWARDHGPLITLEGDTPILNHFRFNGWGGKFEAGLDGAIVRRLHAQGSFGRVAYADRDLVLEGGAVETDGAGTLLATRSSVITETRNPGVGEAAIEGHLAEWLGLDRCLWLDHGDISGDDTDGHVDTLARFAGRDTIVYATAPAGDADHAALTALADQLGGLRTRDDRPYRLLPLPFPGVHRDADGRRLPATYANFLIVNGAVLLPVYGVPQDAEARAVLARAFPGRTIVAVDCRAIIEQNGSLHCLTMQFPAAVALHDSSEFAAA
jgi:agmatine/peptidylarginine deiminase